VDWPPNVHLFTEDRLRPRELADGLTVWGAKALDMLQALNTGHEGSLSTAHANFPNGTPCGEAGLEDLTETR